MTYMIEAPLSPELRADLVFTACDPVEPDSDWPLEIEIIEILPLGIVPPMEPRTLRKLAYTWLSGIGYDACCRLVEAKRGEA
jgi:hypothetical protein